MSRPARATINTTALQHNLNIVRQLSPNQRVMAVVKANAYGHGIVSTATALSTADEFGVASIDEAQILRDAGIEHPIVALEGIFSAAEIPLFTRHQVGAVFHSEWQLEAVENASPKGKIDAWLKVDTGMNRLGFTPTDVDSKLARLRACKNIGEIGLLSHLARADEIDADATKIQLDRFTSVVKKHKLPRSLANSAGIVSWPESHVDVVRPGIMLYGSSPVIGKSAVDIGLKAAMTVKSELIAINQRRKGEAVGYGGDWTCPADMSVGVIAFGYGDGYPRHAAHGTPVYINDARAPIVGRVSMDMITVDLRSVDARVGDEVELWGEHLSIDEVAHCAGTISYELMCQITDRVSRSTVDQ